MDQLLQHLVNAAVLGGTYALLGIGLTLIFGIMRVVNFTHGELYAFGAYSVYWLAATGGVNFFLAIPISIAAACCLAPPSSTSSCGRCAAPISTRPCS